ncbi:MAG: tetratricopeptide repeat protein [Calditrichaeota bacterium]|nr:tetratricopeptide repeat protein [Calditrichota bacterium]
MLNPKKKLSKKELKEDKFVLAVLRAREVLEEHSRTILYGILGVLVIFLLASFYSQSKKKAQEEASVLLSEAQVALGQGDENAAIAKLNDLSDRYEGTPSAGYATFLLGKLYWQKNDTLKAKTYFKRYIDNYADDKFLTQAALAGYADCLILEKNYAEAARYYERAAKVNPEFPEAPGYLYSAAMAYMDAGELEKARKVLDHLMEKYEDSPYKSKAEMLLAQLRFRS